MSKQLKETDKIKNLKVENKQIRRKIDISNINAETIEAFLIYLDL